MKWARIFEPVNYFFCDIFRSEKEVEEKISSFKTKVIVEVRGPSCGGKRRP